MTTATDRNYRRKIKTREELLQIMGSLLLLSERCGGLTGKTLSAQFGPRDTEAFQQHIQTINESHLYPQCRINPVNLPENPLKATLVKASAPRRSS